MNIFSFQPVSGTYTLQSGWKSVLIVPLGTIQIVNSASPPQSITVSAPISFGNGTDTYDALIINGTATIITNGAAQASSHVVPGSAIWGAIGGNPVNQADIQNGTLQGAFTPVNAAIAQDDTFKTALQKAQGQINAISLADWALSGNTLTTRKKFGSESGAFGWDYRLNGATIGAVDNTANWIFGTGTAFTSTYISVKSKGNSSATYAMGWNDSSDANIASLRDDGLLTSKKFTATTTVDDGTQAAFYISPRILDGNSQNGHGFKDDTDFREAGFSYASFDAKARANSGTSENFDHMIGFQSRISFETEGATTNGYAFGDFITVIDGTVSNLYGFYTAPSITGGTGATVTNRFGVRIRDTQGAGILVNNYGLFIDPLTNGSGDNYGIYLNGLVNTYFGTGDNTFAGTINKITFTAPATSATLTIANGKTLTTSNTLTFTGTDSSSVAFGAGGIVAYTTSPTFITDITVPTIYGSAASGGNLQLNSTSNATKGKILFGTLGGYDIANQYYGIGTQSPAAVLHLAQNITAAAWTTNGIGLRIAAATYTDNSSSGTVSRMYIHNMDTATLIASSATTYTVAATLHVGLPVQSTNVIITNRVAIHTSGNIAIEAGASSFIGNIENQIFSLRTNNTNRINITGTGIQTITNDAASNATFITYTQSANSGGSGSGLLWTAGAHTGQTASTEITDINYNLSANMTISTGTVANMRATRIQGRTYTPTSSTLTLTKASTLSVSTPIAGSGTTITTIAAIECDGNFLLPTIGNKIIIKEGTGGFMGQVALVAGTKAITVTGVTTSSRAFVTLVTPGSTTLTTTYQAVCTANTITLQANVAAGTINIADTSTLNYIIFEPAP